MSYLAQTLRQHYALFLSIFPAFFDFIFIHINTTHALTIRVYMRNFMGMNTNKSFIKTITFTQLELPLAKAITMRKMMSDGGVVLKQFQHFSVWLCEVTTSDGQYGQGYTYSIPLDVARAYP